jgi:hypothetical protein
MLCSVSPLTFFTQFKVALIDVILGGISDHRSKLRHSSNMLLSYTEVVGRIKRLRACWDSFPTLTAPDF